MSLLTGKAVYSYHNWFTENKRDLRKSCLDDTCDNALIIEWFDSVGIYINTYKWNYKNWASALNIPCRVFIGNKFISRTEAITEAIKQANIIYNNR